MITNEMIEQASAESTGPLKVVIYGPEKIGKSSTARDAPRSIFLDVDQGIEELRPKPKRFPEPDKGWSFDYILECVDWLIREDHNFESTVLDTLTKIEPLIWAKQVELKPTHSDGKKIISIKQIEDYPFSSGFTMCLDLWRILLARLERLRTERNMHIIATCHSQIRMVENPLGANYEQYDLALNKHAAGTWCRWAGAILFAHREMAVTKDDPNNKWLKAKGLTTGRRLLLTEDCPAYRAGNRYSLPSELPLSWDALWEAARGGSQETAEQVAARVLSLATGTEFEDKAVRAIEKFKDPQKLRGFENWLKVQLANKEIENEPNSNG